MVGHFGSEDRMFYSVVGGAVSVNFWLSNLNKRYGTRILASHAIRENTTRDFIWRWVDRVGVFDHDGVFDVHELCGYADDAALIAQRDYISRYEAALALRFVDQDPDAALDRFYALQEQYPDDIAVAWQIDCIRKTGEGGEA
jgi:adenylate cyclase